MVPGTSKYQGYRRETIAGECVSGQDNHSKEEMSLPKSRIVNNAGLPNIQIFLEVHVCLGFQLETSPAKTSQLKKPC